MEYIGRDCIDIHTQDAFKVKEYIEECMKGRCRETYNTDGKQI